MRIAVAAVLSSLLALPARGDEWRVGLGAAYLSGIQDVADLYEENLRAAGFEADVDVRVPLGLAFGATYGWNSDVRVDLGVGPTFFISGDVDHFELPLSATLGYTFMSGSDISPYVRGGLVHHIVSGDDYATSSPGLLAAVGLDFYRFAIEAGFDGSEVEFDTLSCSPSGSVCTPATETLNTYDFMVSFIWKFHPWGRARR